MKLAIATPNVVRGDGQGRANYEITRAALRQGIQVTLLASRVAPELVEEGAAWIRIQPLLRQPNLAKVYFEARHNTREAGRLDHMDVVHSCGFSLHGPHHVNTAQFVHSAWLKSPAHIARQRRDLYGAYQWLYSTLNARWEKQAYRQAQVVVPVSQQVGRELEAIGIPASKQRVIHNGVDLEEFCPGREDRAELGLPQDVPLALFVGDIRTGRKNLDTVLKALAQVPDMRLAVVGHPENSPFPAMAGALGVADRVYFLGYRRDVARIMRASDVFVFPSRYEACSLVLLEALASGLPVITAQTTGGSEALTPQCGILLPHSEDTTGMVAAMQQMLDASQERRACMRQAARATAENYGWQRITSAYLELYHEISVQN